MREATVLVDNLVKKILKEKSSVEIELFNQVYEYLSKEDTLKKADLIFVFGSKTPTRIEKAVEIYNNDFAKRIMVSGGNPFYEKEEKISESERYKNFAVDKGVKGKNIVIESKSITIPDNVRSSLNLLDKKDIYPKSIILVNSPYVQRRGWCHFKKYLPDSVELIRVNSLTIDKYSQDEWYKNEDGIRVVVNEFIKMRIAVILNTA